MNRSYKHHTTHNHAHNNGQITLESMSQALWYNQWTLDFFKQYLHGNILEIGCGIGNFTTLLPPHGHTYAIDIEPSYIKTTKMKLKKRAHVGFGDIEKGLFFFKKTKFDTLICLNVLEHIRKHKKSIRNMHLLLKPNKHLILLVPAHPILYGNIDKAIGHYRRYTKNELIQILHENCFHIKLYRQINTLGAIGWFIAGRLMGDSIVSKKKLKLFDRIARFVLPFEKIFGTPFGTSFLVVAIKK